MKISLCNEVLWPIEFGRQCDFARAVGYDGLEIAPHTLAEEAYRLDRAQRAEIRRTAADAGIAITGLHMLLMKPEGLSITTQDATLRARTIDVLRHLIDLCADLGGGVLVHGSPQGRRLEPGREADGRRRAADSFAALAGHAQSAGVVYCVEALAFPESDCINTVQEAADIVRAVGNPALRTMIDCSAAGRMEQESVADLIRRWMPSGLIAHMHFNDPNRRGPGEGDMQFAPIIAALAETGYAGDASVEPFVFEPDPPSCAARQIGYLRALMEAENWRRKG